jgi:tetratricopeptide (TPR) repeat protein
LSVLQKKQFTQSLSNVTLFIRKWNEGIMKDLISQLKAVSFDKPESIIHSLDLLHFHFSNADYSFSTSNKVIMLGDHMSEVNMSMDEKIKTLNSIFFDKEKLFVGQDDEAPIYLKHFFDKHIGNITLVSIVYQYLLKKMNVNFKIWSTQQAHLIKVYDKDKTYVINLNEKGLKAKGKDLSEPPDEISTSVQFQFYTLLSKIADQLLMQSNFKKTLEVYNCILELFPEKVFWYARRGLLQKSLGQFQEALKDLDKYSNYVSEKDFSSSVVQALIELKGLKYVANSTSPALTH